MIKKPVGTVCCATYNHQNYIKEAINSFISQKTDFPFEILIHDDASTDNTPQIVSEYEKRYPEKIKAKNIFKNVSRAS